MATQPPNESTADGSASGGGTPASDLLDVVVNAMGGAHRAGQHEMVREVESVIEVGGTLLAQAGTGTGKSLGYLVPSIAHAVAKQKRVIVSTATLALQRQLIARDLPMVTKILKDHLPTAPKFAVLKGWQNYACLQKLEGGYPAEDDFLFDLGVDHPAPAPASESRPGGYSGKGPSAKSLGEEVMRLREWAVTSPDGDRDELDPGVSDRAWRQISVTTQECIGQKCRLINECFPERAKALARAADVVVTNHAMLAIAASGNAGLLPEHDVVVIDEAHELVSRVTSASAVELSVKLVETAGKLARRQGADGVMSLEAARSDLTVVLAGVGEGRFTHSIPDDVADVIAAVRDSARMAMTGLKPSAGGAQESGDDPGSKVALAAVTTLYEVCERVLAQNLAKDVMWAAKGPQDTTAVIHVAPLDVAGIVHDGILATRSAVLTSATLALGGSFDSVARSLGLFQGESKTGFHADVETAGERWRGVSVTSPFEYPKQGILYIAKHLPPPGRDGTSPQHMEELAELMTASGGRTLGLFSSRRGATAAAEALRDILDTPILCQGDDQLPVLVRKFAENPEVSLFGSLSLWQGVDVPGKSCQLVVIDRLPFPRPDDPIASARTQLVQQRGGNGFMQVSASHAALLLAQGVGRLIRSVDDRGVVAVLDARLETARYGGFLKQSLPPMWQTTDRNIALGALQRLSASD